ncbi:sulfurtransferase [Pseudomonas sp. S9]|uniref:sulfurtransferase n=1 Tax=Pseudomonas sp. S9 TaxID=686578 RepID=UPI0002557087|nr:sulfurtransferase [Pseudomonas sp. S9]
MPIAQLITAEQLHKHLQAPGTRIFDCRFALDDKGYGRRSFAEGHIQGAQFLDLEDDLSGEIKTGITGRHPLPQPLALTRRLAELGLDNESRVILYDDGPGAYAARAWWLLAWLGKREGVFVLDGGLKAWREAGLPVTSQVQPVTAGNFSGQPDSAMVLTAEQLQARLDRPEMTLLDARALPRFKGEVEPLDPVAGHIPGAQCAVFTDNLDSAGRFLPATELRQRFSDLLGQRQAEQLVAYCGSGVTACHNLFSLCLAGYPLAALYAGSWSEWITNQNRPIATGE